MKSLYDGYRKILTGGKRIFFAGANTAEGFAGDYAEIADEKKLERIYIIKGGPGTGKSTIIRKIAKSVESRGIKVEYYLCGSDPDSLDCAVFDGRVAILDGTSPHTLDMMYPGATSQIVDVSKFWNDEYLERQKSEIIRHSAEKSAHYASAYRYLKATEAVDAELYSLSESIVNREKLIGYVNRFIKKLGKNASPAKGNIIKRHTHALTMKGSVYLPTLKEKADIVFTLSDVLGSAAVAMKLFEEKLTEAGFSIILSPLPATGRAAGIFIKDHGIAITAGEREEGERIINMSRFISDDIPQGVRGSIKLAIKCGESCIEEALSNLSAAAKHHFALEDIYKKSVHFESLGDYTTLLCDEIIKRLL